MSSPLPQQTADEPLTTSLASSQAATSRPAAAAAAAAPAAGLPSPRVALLATVSRDDVAIKQATFCAPEGSAVLRRHVAIVDALARGEV